jgi:hypothetical protein
VLRPGVFFITASLTQKFKYPYIIPIPKMALDDNIGPPESEKKEAPSERYVVIRRGEPTVIEKRKYLLAQVIRKKTTEYSVQPKYVPAQNL